MMEANRAEAERCVDMGFEYAAGGDSAKAIKMMNKALRLDPGVNLKDLRKRIENSGMMNDEKTTPTEDTSFMNGGSAYYGHDEHYNEHPADNVRSRGKFRSSKSQPTMDDATADSGVPSSSSGFSAQSSNGSTKTGVGVDRKKSHRSRTRSAGKPQLGVDYTQDECDTVQRIRHCKDYYEILNVQKDATDAHLKKEYRKLALALHPDKCRAPGATEAFKALGNAYAVLSNTEKRQRYDMYGNETPQVRHRHAGDFYEYDFGRGFEAEFTPEEIFNMFFGGGYPTGAMNRRRGGASYRFHNNDTNNAQQAEPGYGPLIQLLPLLAIFILGIIGQLMVGEPAFSLQRNGKYTDERYTKEMQIAYYVKADFLKNYRGRLQQIEQQVEDEYVTNLRMNCYRERNQKETLAWRARTFGDSAMWDKSQRMTMPNCDRLQQLYGQ